MGYIYILTNPSFRDYIKIGYADNVEQRLQQLNNSECIPYAFHIYATYEVESRLSDKKLHSIIDKLNPELRSIDTVNGKERKREFYAMSPEDAYAILEAIAEIHNCTDHLKKWDMTIEEQHAEECAEQVQKTIKERTPNFTFDWWEIPVGAILEHKDDPEITFIVVSNRKLNFCGEIMYMTPFARYISGNSNWVHGPEFIAKNFKYKGKLLSEIEESLHSKK